MSLPISFAMAAISSISASSSCSLGTRRTSMPWRNSAPAEPPPAMPMSACRASPGPLTTQPMMATVMGSSTPARRFSTSLAMDSTSMHLRPQVGQETMLTASRRRPMARRMLMPAATSGTGSPDSDTRMVSPMPSSRSEPMPMSLLTLPMPLRPASVTPRCSG